ncbi:MAG: hypothetical protein CVT93_09405 [Bacteroidetes bacterium HGW-Bacteroidetes-10]|nr:MAG: hypothetical protein CVT93_09405 [Bacteroidetes bacterium HGW-Bacteroidetes-10]
MAIVDLQCVTAVRVLKMKLCQSFYELADLLDVAIVSDHKSTYLKYCYNLVFKNMLKTLAELNFVAGG